MKRMIVCPICSQVKEEYAKGLCTKCYQKELRESLTGTCHVCHKQKPLSRIGICGACRERQRVKTKAECNRCGRILEIKGHGMCAACFTANHRAKTGYKGPIRKCIDCGEEKPIKAQNRCDKCYQRMRIGQNPEYFSERKRKYVARNRERTLAGQKKWRDENKEHRSDYWKQYYAKNRVRLDHNRRINYHKNRIKLLAKLREKTYRKIADGQPILIRRVFARSPEEIIENLINQIPEFKKPWVQEFLKGAYSGRDGKTKIRFLSDLLRLINYIGDKNPETVNGSWNMLNLIQIEKCQVHRHTERQSPGLFSLVI